MPRGPSRAVRGRAVAGDTILVVFLERSSFLGRWRPAGMSGDSGSFLTRIFGAEAFRELYGVRADWCQQA